MVVAALGLFVVVEASALAEIWGLEGVPEDLERLGLDCGEGQRAACKQINERYRTGNGLPADRNVARQFMEQSCLGQGDAGHSAGLKAAQAAEKRARPCYQALTQFLRRGCTQGDTWDCVRLAQNHRYGMGVPTDAGAARTLFEQVCMGKGDPIARGNACDQLGELFEKGDGGPRDPARALALHERACADIPSSCLRLGALQERGTLGPPDREAARRSYKRACDNRSPAACEALRKLEAAPR